jgi:gluconolactonase
VPSPNGIALNRSEKVVFVAATRSCEIWILPMGDNGNVTKAGLFARLPSLGPDGMAVDDKANVAVAHPGIGIVWLFDRRGLPVARIESCEVPMVMNIAYGGPQNRWLYITEAASGSVLRAEMPEPGLPMFSHGIA